MHRWRVDGCNSRQGPQEHADLPRVVTGAWHSCFRFMFVACTAAPYIGFYKRAESVQDSR